MKPENFLPGKEFSPNQENPQMMKSEDPNDPQNIKLSKNGINITLIDKTKLDYSQLIDAIQITERQIQKILQFCAEKEPQSRKFLEDQLRFMTEVKQKFESIRPILQNQKENVMKRLNIIRERKSAYTKEQSQLETTIIDLDKNIKELEANQKALTSKIEDLTVIRNNTSTLFNEGFFRKAKSLLQMRNQLMWNICEHFVGLFLAKEKGTTQDIQEAFSDFNRFYALINNVKLDAFDKSLIEQKKMEISKVQQILAPQNADPAITANKDVYDPFIGLAECVCDMAYNFYLLMNNKAQITQFGNDKASKDNELNKKKLTEEIFTEDTYLEDQIKAYDKILDLLNQHIEKKEKDIKSVQSIVNGYPQEYYKELGRGVTAAEKEMVYKQGSQVKY